MNNERFALYIFLQKWEAYNTSGSPARRRNQGSGHGITCKNTLSTFCSAEPLFIHTTQIWSSFLNELLSKWFYWRAFDTCVL